MRKMPKRWSVRFELGPEEADHVRLHDYLDILAESGEASEWIRQTLIAALPSQHSGFSAGKGATTKTAIIGLPKKVSFPGHGYGETSKDLGNVDNNVTYEDIE